MFNQMTAPEVVTAIGLTARRAGRSADSGGEFSEFDRSQLMSAYSASRHLSVELTTYQAEFDRFTTALADRLDAAGSELQAAPAVQRLRDSIAAGAPPSAVGADLCELFADWRQHPTESVAALRTELHVLLRELADREVDLLAEGLG